MSNELLEAALRYAARGWFVIPDYPVNSATTGNPCACARGRACTSPGKHPRIESWESEATTDSEKIKAWWADRANSNVGIATGPSRLVVVDVDGEEGALSLISLIEGKDWPDTIRFASGSGKGTHYLFSAPPGVDLRNKQEWKAAPGVDIRAGGGQIVAPPSLHQSGGRYRELPGGPPTPAPVPTWLAVLLAAEAAKRDRGPADNTPPPREGPAEPSPRARAALRKYERLQTTFDVEKASRTNALGGAALDLFGFVKSGELRYETAIDALRALGAAWGWFARYGEEEFQRQVMINAWGNARAKEPSDHPAHLAWEQGMAAKDQSEEEEKPERKSTAKTLLELVGETGIEFWHTEEKKAFASIPVGNHREHYPIASTTMRLWLQRLYYQAVGGVPNSQALQDVLGILQGRAIFDGPEYPVYVRVAECEGRLYLDLADPDWRAIEIDPSGWRVVDAPPVRFRRASGMTGLPLPEPGGSLEDLRPFLNTPRRDLEEGEDEAQADAQWVMAVAWLLNALNPWGPYSILVIQGEHGSAKSTTSAILRATIDPNTCALRPLPKDERDLNISAQTSWVLCYNNVSGLPEWLSDALCRISTEGGGFATRKLHTDDEEQLFKGRRPVILNGIDDVATKADLADRALVLNLPRIEKENRKREKKVWEDFGAAHPRILGAILDVVAGGLKELPRVEAELREFPRMAELSLWVTACEGALGWPAGTFNRIHDDAQKNLSLTLLEGSKFAAGVKAYVESLTDGWEGTASALLKALNDSSLIEDSVKRRKEWPRDAIRLSSSLRRVAPTLRAAGFSVEWGKTKKERKIVIKAESKDDSSSPSSPSSPTSKNNNLSGDDEFAPSSPFIVSGGYPADWDDE